MYSTLQHSLGPLSTPMFLAVCYSLSTKHPGVLKTPAGFPSEPPHTSMHWSTLASLLLALDHNALYEGNCENFCFYCQNQSALTRLKEKKRDKKDKLPPHSNWVSWLLVWKDLWVPGSNIQIKCCLTPFNTPLTHMFVFLQFAFISHVKSKTLQVFYENTDNNTTANLRQKFPRSSWKWYS